MYLLVISNHTRDRLTVTEQSNHEITTILDYIRSQPASFTAPWLSDFFSKVYFPQGALITAFDVDGGLIFRQPPMAPAGNNFKDSALFGHISGVNAPGSAFLRGLDGIARFSTFTPLFISGKPVAYLNVEIPPETLFRDSDWVFRLNLIILALVTIVLGLLARVLADAMLVNEIKSLQRLNQMRSEFISFASHQLRSPITSVRWLMEIVLSQRPGPLNEKQKEFLDQAYASVKQMVDLVRDLLSVSRLDSTRISLNPEKTNFLALVRKIVSEFESQTKEKKLNLKIDAPRVLPSLFIDPALTRQVIVNLVSNAIKFTPVGGRVRVEIISRAKELECRVTDSGCGVPGAEQHHIFERFFRASNAQMGQTDGTGLGLYLAKSLVDLSGGKIGFVSEKDKGSTFWFILPRSAKA